MGYEVIAKCHVELEEPFKEDEALELEKLLKAQSADGSLHDLKISTDSKEGYAFFELSGNKGVDYSILDKVKDLLKGHKFSINAYEYIGCDDAGYYYSTED